MRLVTLAAITTCYISAALANPNLNFASIAMADDVPFKLNYSPLDMEIGKELVSLYADLSKNELKKSTVAKFVSYKNKKQSFSHLDMMTNRLELISKISDQDSFYTNCAIQPRQVNEFTENLAHRMDITLDKYCRYLFLKNLSKFSPTINLSTRDLSYLKDAASFYVTGENQTDVSAVLKHFKANKSEHEKISDILIAKYIDFKTKPTSAILVNLHVSTQLNNFLQNNLHLDNNSGTFFQEEFTRLIKDSQDLTDKGEYVQAKAQIIAALNFYSKNKKFIDERKAWVGTTLAAKALYYKGRDNDAVEILTLARAVAPKEEASEATFYLLWPHLINKDYKSMKAVIEKFNMEKNFESFDSKLQYWIAYGLLKTGEAKKATAYFNKIINSSPYSFYSIISLKEIATQNKGMSEQDILAKLISKDAPVEFKMDVTSEELKDALRRLAVWNALGHERFATLEIRHVQSMDKLSVFKDKELAKNITVNDNKEFIVLNLVRLLHSQDKFINSFKVFQDSLGENSLSLNYRLIKYIFPVGYMSLIEKNTDNIDPLIVISLIRQESAFNPLATSRVGAKGLMQLMPATAKRFNRKIRVTHLNDPKVNVALGSKYLKQLLTRFDGNLIYTLASYNAGENRIDRWKKEIFRNDDPLATIESIPFEETRNYVKLIYRNRFFYSLLQNRSVLTTPLDESFKVTSAVK
ncbi:lytic transglycosylase domain-containing protein [Bacteriovorax sp. PP10]|uniref:Lytic transglycosylase domain-containing protein n=1 Tax=Bacteriovorax antarcticus TaxID=3088717 RepID=A0ABU5VP77_9BACT|nr:lytic transglycosylase domain-containing protein [Bacteriovorax sp. PP10]MEA9354843.1 lytic transglycosylase domain-containing protein [Bacteriovorax sp. PP10]